MEKLSVLRYFQLNSSVSIFATYLFINYSFYCEKCIEEQITTWLTNNKDIAIIAVPLFAFLEACVGIGLFVTGVILLTICSVLYTQEIATLSQMLPLAFFGALLGDHSGFWLGKFIGPSFHQTKFANKYRVKVEKAEAMIRQRGYWAIFIGRLIPAIRSLIPLITGISGMSKRKYFTYDVLACLFWSS